MKFNESHYKFMNIALTEARKSYEHDEVPVGAVVVFENKIIGKGHNQCKTLNDSTAHAEMIAISAASNNLQSQFLQNCTIYITLEPCAMCAGAILLARIPAVYFASFEPKFGACGSVFNLTDSESYNFKPKVFSGLLEKESSDLLKEYFEKKRKIISK